MRTYLCAITAPTPSLPQLGEGVKKREKEVINNCGDINILTV